MKRILLTMGLGMMSVVSAFAADEITLGDPQYGGTGCPSGSVGASLSPDRTSLSILFDQYVAEAGSAVGKTFDRKSCNVAIPVRVPHGYTVAILKVDYRGYNNLPRQARSTFGVEYFFAGSRGPTFQRDFVGPLDRDYVINNELIASSMVWSPCGQDVILRTNTSIRVTTNSQRQQAMATVDSQDVSAAVVYQLKWQRCN